MSSLFKEISQQAIQQREQIAQASTVSAPVTPIPPLLPAADNQLAPTPQVQITDEKPAALRVTKKVVPQSGATAPQKSNESPHLDMEKLKTIIEEISVMPTNNNGLNVRMSHQEMQDLEDFVLITLRKQGMRGDDFSTAKLMRYAMRYMFRVHEKEFITALKQALKTEETLSI